MAEKVFCFKTASVGGEDNRIIINCQNPSPGDRDIVVENRNMAYYLAVQLDGWLTPDTVSRVIQELGFLGH